MTGYESFPCDEGDATATPGSTVEVVTTLATRHGQDSVVGYVVAFKANCAACSTAAVAAVPSMKVVAGVSE